MPELSRRGRAIPVWAVLRCLGRDGVADTVLNNVVFTQVCVTLGSDDRTDEVVRRLLLDGTTWVIGSSWHGRRVLRISVSNWSTTEGDVERCMAALRRVANGVG